MNREEKIQYALNMVRGKESEIRDVENMLAENMGKVIESHEKQNMPYCRIILPRISELTEKLKILNAEYDGMSIIFDFLAGDEE